jgi:hypothetical protein
MLEVIPPPGLDAEALLAQWPTVPPPSLAAVRNALTRMRGKTCGFTGTGTKSDPYRYHRMVPHRPAPKGEGR